jgi:hypothetical protein
MEAMGKGGGLKSAYIVTYSNRKKSRRQFTGNGFTLLMGLLGNRAEARILFDENKEHIFHIFRLSPFSFRFRLFVVQNKIF